MSLFEYISLSATAWFMGFFPMFEIYLAIPSTMLLGLDHVSAVLWAGFGNFLPVPLLAYFYDWLHRFKRLSGWLDRLEKHRFSHLMREHGSWSIILVTPLLGSWVVGVIGHSIGMRRSTLLIYSAISIFGYGVIIAWLTSKGIEFTF
ncbi:MULTISPECIES: small multi-drug export protein [Exiguobacterium]|uniref:small multi-drug export protein n=1 Tax=Exiguobacterium TaxID=33986 RepID=UPI001BA64BA7|nr:MULTISPECIES: small multi-drug export protein [Exiguobacterium]QUE87281.1 small multi-drug export protein [Exiguobacterium alkaliphilum]